MPRWMQVVGVGLVLLCAGYIYMNLPFVTKRMRVTLEFEVDGKPVAASGVVEATINKRWEWLSLSTAGASWRGEAIPIELAGHGVLFAVFAYALPLDHRGKQRIGGHPATMLVSAFNPLNRRTNKGSLGGLTQSHINEIWWRTGTAEVPREEWPILIRFTNTGNPMSAQGIEPDNLEPVLGTNIRLKRVLLAMVTEPLTNGIIKRLPWLEQFPTSNPLFSGRLGVRAGDLGLGSMHFWRQ